VLRLEICVGFILNLVAFQKENNNLFISSISTLYIATIEDQIKESYPNLSDKEIDNHPRLINEIERQIKILNRYSADK